ncbi:hypothetical protein [Muricauda sp. TY007]|nr:hypothetical protein [Muricauda sp. TY007]
MQYPLGSNVDGSKGNCNDVGTGYVEHFRLGKAIYLYADPSKFR